MVEIKRHQQKGKLIAVEGLDGSGKSTQIYLLKRWLEIEGYKVFFTEWNSSFLVKRATKKAKKSKLLTPTTFSLIHATDFADRYERQIWPLLCAGYIVLADRYFFTAFARDVTRGCDPEWVETLYSFAALPDITFFFHIDPAIAIARILDGRPELKYHEAGMDMNLSSDPYESFKIFQGRVNEAYEQMSKPFGFTKIDSNRTADVMQQEVRAIVKERIDLPAFKLRSKVDL
ncbi:MAG: dTMP kinase [Calditrichaeota bacterium]|nr:MAG: dTMP kinase [Calditrichota bacterium]